MRLKTFILAGPTYSQGQIKIEKYPDGNGKNLSYETGNWNIAATTKRVCCTIENVMTKPGTGLQSMICFVPSLPRDAKLLPLLFES